MKIKQFKTHDDARNCCSHFGNHVGIKHVSEVITFEDSYVIELVDDHLVTEKDYEDMKAKKNDGSA